MRTIAIMLIFLLAAPVMAHAGNEIQVTSSDGGLIATVSEGEHGDAAITLSSGTRIELDEQFESFSKTLLQANEQEKPAIVKRFVKNQAINVYVEENDTAAITAGLKIDQDAEVTELRLGSFSDPTLNIYVSKAVFENKEQSLDTLSDAIANEEIRFEAIGFGNKLKIGLLKTGLKIASWFA